MSEKNLARVTGASAGIGVELARLLASKGFNLMLLARNRNKLEVLAGELKTAHCIQVTVVAADLGEPDAPQAVCDELLQKGIQVNFLVNNAGLMIEARFTKTRLHNHRQLLQVNVLALTALIRLFMEPMLARNSRRILNVASVAAFMPVPNLAVYAASKAYVLSFSEALSEEIKGSKVTVTALCPGVTDTGMVHGTDLGSLPRFMIMDAKTVAREGYNACMEGKTVHVAGTVR